MAVLLHHPGLSQRADFDCACYNQSDAEGVLPSPTLTGRVAGPTALSSYEPPLDDAIASTRNCGSAGCPTFLPQTKVASLATILVNAPPVHEAEVSEKGEEAVPGRQRQIEGVCALPL